MAFRVSCYLQVPCSNALGGSAGVVREKQIACGARLFRVRSSQHKHTAFGVANDSFCDRAQKHAFEAVVAV